MNAIKVPLIVSPPCNITQSHGKNRPPYYGRLIGPLADFAHTIKGTVYAVDESTLFIKGFAYDGTGPDAFFWVGNSPRPSPEGYIIPYPEDYVGREPPILNAHNNTDVILRLPMGRRMRDIRWLSVWCRRFTVDFGEVFIPPGLDPPRARVLPELKRLAHGLRSGNVSVLDARTFYIPNLHYDGAGPDAYFWVGTGSEPNPYGIKVPNEVGSLEPLRGYQGEDIELQLPGNLTAHDIDWLGVWCVQYRHNFGHVNIPKDLDVPPALGQTKITPPWWYNPTSSTAKPAISNKSNCRELLDRRMQVRWEIQGDQIEIELSARIRADQYMSFGVSGIQGKPSMIGADLAVVFWNESTSTAFAVDYVVTHASQCDGNNGVCPDTRLGGVNDVTLVSGSRKDGITTVIYKRPLAAKESSRDKAISKSTQTSVIAAFGPLNSRQEANAHSITDKTTDEIKIDFSSNDDNACEGLADLTNDGIKPWPSRIITGETVFSTRIGPTGGKRGYSAITGKPSWGIAWYLNDLLIPEIYVERGQTYQFVVEGGDDRTNPAKYHPFYICDSPEGGFGQKSEIEQKRQRVFAGVSYDSEGYPYPTAAGRYCEWTHKTIDKSMESETFESYTKTLQLECERGDQAILNWTVEQETPDLLYYQCYTHTNLGWKIHVINPGANIIPGASILVKE
ncbi:protein Skeletor, isoforms B/C [Arctopsyche grandis]|uniref:protein Skeletor, isoforms B/C n=1 Tax=Arctopsyche grandis TaxID=121162 RepID=UPI00406D8484